MSSTEREPVPVPFTRAAGSQGEEPSVDLVDGTLRIRGYQSFDISGVPPKLVDHRRPKLALAQPYLASLDRRSSVLDVGCSAGLNGLTLALMGFEAVTFVDHDAEYLSVVSRALDYLGLGEGTEVHELKFSDIAGGYDVTLVLALVHWLVDSTEEYASLDSVVRHLSDLTNSTLVIEWIEPTDQCFDVWPSGVPEKERYSREVFLESLRRYFPHVRSLGRTAPARSLWLASRERPTRSVRAALSPRFTYAKGVSVAYRLAALRAAMRRRPIRQ